MNCHQPSGDGYTGGAHGVRTGDDNSGQLIGDISEMSLIGLSGQNLNKII